jgi:hypothetical protein
MRFLLAFVLVACAAPKAPAEPVPPTSGACTNGALIGTQRVECAREHACVLADKVPRCVALAEAEQTEPCGMISCGAGCSCASPHECLCPHLGAP